MLIDASRQYGTFQVKKMPKIDTLDALDDDFNIEHTLNTL